MMGLHQNYPVTWASEKMDGLTLDLGLDGMFSPLPTDANATTKESDSSWRFLGQSPTSLITSDLDDDPCSLIQSDCGPERKPEMFELSLSYPVVQDQQLLTLKAERQDVEPNRTTRTPSLPTDLILENEGSFNTWRNIEFPRKELHLYGSVGDETTEVFQDAMSDVTAIKQERPLSSVPAGQQHPETIILDDDDSDDEFFLDEQYTEEDAEISIPFSDRGGGQERGYLACPPGLPLRQIKHHVRSVRNDDYSCLTPSSIRGVSRNFGLHDVETGERNQVVVTEHGKMSPKRVRAYGDHDWLPSGLVDIPHYEKENESKRARGNAESDQAHRLPMDGKSYTANCTDNNVQGHVQKPQIDVNHAILDMPEDTAEAFKELFRLVGASGAAVTGAVDEREGRRPVTHGFQPPPASETSPHPVVYQHHAGKRVSNADVVLYEPKPEPLESWRENSVGTVVHVKQEVQLYEPVPDHVFVRPIGESAVASCLSTRKLILTALSTFEQCRQHIIKDPSYGQSSSDVLKPNCRRLRADLKAACLMRKKGFWLNERVRPIGEVPGVSVGDCFRYRIEMAVIGLHRAVQAGIAVVPLGYSPYGVTVASSVVIGVSDPYQDDNDMGDTVVYSGQGGLCGKTKESQDQELKRGNLALSNSYDRRLPVRLIRGHREQNSMTGILYSYDGIYQITDMRYVDGVNGKKVYKFTMQRLPGQAPVFYKGYPAPLVSQPPAIQPIQNAVGWTESSQVEPLYLDKSPVG